MRPEASATIMFGQVKLPGGCTHLMGPQEPLLAWLKAPRLPSSDNIVVTPGRGYGKHELESQAEINLSTTNNSRASPQRSHPTTHGRDRSSLADMEAAAEDGVAMRSERLAID